MFPPRCAICEHHLCYLSKVDVEALSAPHLLPWTQPMLEYPHHPFLVTRVSSFSIKPKPQPLGFFICYHQATPRIGISVGLHFYLQDSAPLCTSALWRSGYRVKSVMSGRKAASWGTPDPPSSPQARQPHQPSRPTSNRPTGCCKWIHLDSFSRNVHFMPNHTDLSPSALTALLYCNSEEKLIVRGTHHLSSLGPAVQLPFTVVHPHPQFPIHCLLHW